ncbi:mitochondrial carrier domain-containing protein [Chytridium lagenaria]|nr:mitochondrial carrier domain-containing protein [Chytridium lagenaria]
MSATEQKKGGASQTVKELFAGCVGGIVQVLTGQPFDTVKVRLQTQPDKYTNLIDCVKKTYANEGFVGFYKGTLTPLIGIGACVSIQFGALEASKRFFALRNPVKDPNALSLSQLYLSGAFSGFANSFLSGPIEHVRTRLQVQAGNAASAAYKGPVDFAKKVVGLYGVQGLYKGQGITLLRECHGYGIYFMTYEALIQRTMRVEGKKRNEISALTQCGFGAMSGYTLWIMIYPIDVIKSRLQTDSFIKAEQKYKGSLDCARKILAVEGVRGLYRGFLACMLRAGPVNAVTFVAYEATMSLIGR